ncbi:proline-rich domain-containing protein [Streptomyces sp. NPDC059010]|uniref:proline-rich domain-containing protein n=1 Tax=Streptomyces sp. NPDC059010 TaxID=3346695 RepID=UPI0036AF29D9
MSFGDPNNPYGPPQGQQPGYGYPQQPQAPGYGYPQAPPVGAYQGAMAPTSMPGTVSAARVLLWVIAGLQLLGVALFAFSAASVTAAKNDSTLQDDAAFQQLADYSTGMLWAVTAFALAWGVWAIVLAVKFNSGRNGVRITALVFGILTAILGIYPFIVVGLVHTVLAILVAIFVGNSNGSAWFNRPRY